MSLEQLVGVAIFAFVASVTPGPNNVLLAAIGSAFGVRRGLPTLCGVVCGFTLMIFVIALGVGQTAHALSHAFGAVRVVGVAFLVWLAWQIATAPVANAGTTTRKHRGNAGFIAAAMFQWINPKAWLICTGVVSTYLPPDGGVVVQALTFAVVFFFFGTAGSFPWLTFGSLARRYLRRPDLARAFNAAMAVLLLASMIPIVLPELVS